MAPKNNNEHTMPVTRPIKQLLRQLYLRPAEENGTWSNESPEKNLVVVPAGEEVEERYRELLRIANGKTENSED